MYQSDAMKNEWRKLDEKRQREEYKQLAFRDATQWKSFIDDHTGMVLFLSHLTGEIRTGVYDALDWSVEDDGIGLPCFVNHVTNMTVYEDPRFNYEVAESMLIQRRYVMQELRLAVYVCKDLYESYIRAQNSMEPKSIQAAMMAIRNSPKTLHLDAFLIRAKVRDVL